MPSTWWNLQEYSAEKDRNTRKNKATT